MQLGIGRIGEFQFPVLFALTLILLSSPLMFHVKWGNYVQALGGSETALKRSGVRTGFYRISVSRFFRYYGGRHSSDYHSTPEFC